MSAIRPAAQELAAPREAPPPPAAPAGEKQAAPANGAPGGDAAAAAAAAAALERALEAANAVVDAVDFARERLDAAAAAAAAAARNGGRRWRGPRRPSVPQIEAGAGVRMRRRAASCRARQGAFGRMRPCTDSVPRLCVRMRAPYGHLCVLQKLSTSSALGLRLSTLLHSSRRCTAGHGKQPRSLPRSAGRAGAGH